jgi:glycosyltransferase involved in cell wall biosynthesis
MSGPSLSILIPTHDRPALLQEALDSVLHNGMEDIEIVVSDDSPGASAEAVVASFCDPRIRYTRNVSGTKAENWDHAIRQSSAPLVFKLDDDDRIRPGFLKRCCEILDREPDVASVYTGYTIFWPDGRKEEIIDRDFFPNGRVAGEVYLRGVLANEGGYPRTQKTAAVFRRSAARRIDYYQHASEDFAFSAALGLSGGVVYIPEALYEWRIQSGSGVRDLRKTWQLSDEACEGLLRLPREILLPEVKNDWERLVRAAQSALPLFYLRAAFVDIGWLEGWRFWNAMRQSGGCAWSPLVLFCLTVAAIVPRPLLRYGFGCYQHSRCLQRWMAGALARQNQN